MEIWLDCRHSIENTEIIKSYPFDKIISKNPISSCQNLICDNDSVFWEQRLIGSVITIRDQSSQDKARELVGSLDWIILEFENWSMIPIENIIAACEDTPTKVAAKIRTPSEAQGAGFALERGVDALIINNEIEMIDAAFIIKSQRGEDNSIESIKEVHTNELKISSFEIISVNDGGFGERYCIDLTTLLLENEGLMIGSSASSLALIHGETIISEFVPPRPFRVNAGPPHSYILMEGGKTKYISELNSNDSVLITNSEGKTRIGRIGRLKIEKRPFLQIVWNYVDDKPASLFLQQAETVRLVDSSGALISVTSLKPGDKILGWSDKGSRHIGEKISSMVDER